MNTKPKAADKNKTLGKSDPELLALNDSAFTDPTPEVLEELRGRGVRFLFANDMAGEVSPRLDELATKVFAQGPVTIYEI